MPRTLFIALLCSAFAAPAFAQGPGQPSGPGQGQGGHHGPPQEALDACKGKKDGEPGQMRTPRGDTMSGTCRLVLVPSASPADSKAPAGGQRKDSPVAR